MGFILQSFAALLCFSALLVPASGVYQNVQQVKPVPPEPVANFVDVAEKAGLNAINVFGGKKTKKYIIETTGTGVAIIDYDGDGWPDIFLLNGTTLDAKPGAPGPTNQLFRNNRDGTFTDTTEKAGLRSQGWAQGVCVGDYDNDGWPDMFVTYYGNNRLYHNQANGTFKEVAEIAGVAGRDQRWGTGCAFVDYDRDGMLDLVVANYVDFDMRTAPAPGEGVYCHWKGIAVMCGPRGLKPSSNLLYHNLGNGKFADVTKQAGIENTPGHYCLSVSTLDYDNDGWPDIYVACDSTPSILYRNNRNGTFSDVGVVAGAAFNEDGRAQAGMGSTIADYDGDGNLDIFKTNFSDDTATLYRNNGDGNFSDATFAAGLGLHTQYLGWGVMFFDFDNDGWPDLLLVNGHVYPEVDKNKLGSDYMEPRILYRNNGNATFTEVSKVGGPGITVATSARGLAVGDLWNDGRVSAVISNMGAQPSLLVNQAHYNNHWLGIKTVGTRSNRDGIGARVSIKAGTRIQVNEVRSGSSYNSSSDLRLHFGLGAADKVDWVKVRWPNGATEQFQVTGIDKLVTLKEGDGEAIAAAEKKTAH
jgi:hypothetical protein